MLEMAQRPAWSDMSPGLQYSSIRDALHSITAVSKETGTSHLWKTLFSFC